jgi:hypothetical protein
MGIVSNYRVKVAIGVHRTEAALLTFVLLVVQKMTGNPNFVSPGTYITALAAAATAYQAAMQAMGTTKDVSEARNAAKQGVKDALAHVKDYVNSVVEKLPPDQGMAAIESAGLNAEKRSTYQKPPLEIKYGGLAGSVLIVALAAAKSAMYYFEYSADGKSWSACPSVMKCKTALSGLTIGTTYYFRVHAQTRKGLTDLSNVVSFVVR